MSKKEKYGHRDLTFSMWHREESMKRFIDEEKAHSAAWIDIDYFGYEHKTYRPLVVMEIAQNVGQPHKNFGVVQKAGIDLQVPAYRVLYTPSEELNPILDLSCDPHVKDIKEFNVMMVYPDHKRSMDISPQEMVELIMDARELGMKMSNEASFQKIMNLIPKLTDKERRQLKELL